MAVPEAAMNKDGDFVSFEDQVGRARQVLAVETEAQSHAVGSPAHRDLGCSIARANARHDFTAPLAIDYIGHA